MLTTKMVKQVSSTAALILAGTGSLYSLDRASEWELHLQCRSSVIMDSISAPSHIDARSPAHHLQNIRDTLNLNISEIASLLHVSRQSIYKWLSDTSKPEEDKLARIVAFSTIADAFKEADIQRGGPLLNVKIVNGQSLNDLLQSGQPYIEALSALVQEAKITKLNYQKAVLSQARECATNDWQSSISIPSYSEDL